MIVILDVDGQKFSFNGVNYYKNFLPKVIGDKIEILNTYDSNVRLTDYPTKYDEFSVNGTTYANVSDLQNNLLSVIFSRVSLTNAGAIKTYQTLADFNAVSPVPEDGTTFFIANDPNDANNGEWSVVSGSPVQNNRTVVNVVEETNTSKGVTGKAVVFSEIENNYKTPKTVNSGIDYMTNRFNKDTAIIGFRLYTGDGTLLPDVNQNTSDFIPIYDKEKIITLGFNALISGSRKSWICFYDKNKNFISSNSTFIEGDTVTPPDGCYFLRISYYIGADNTFMVLCGFEPFIVSEYVGYNEGIYKTDINKLNEVVTDSSQFFENELNHFNKNNAINEFKVNFVYGYLNESATVSTSEFIKVREGFKLTIQGGTGNNAYCWYYSVIDEYFFHEQGANSWSAGEVITVPEGVNYIRFSMNTSELDDVMLLMGTGVGMPPKVLDTYSVYGESKQYLKDEFFNKNGFIETSYTTNAFVESNSIDGFRLDLYSDNLIEASDTTTSLEYVPVSQGDIISGFLDYAEGNFICVFYDSSKNWLAPCLFNADISKQIAPVNASYIRTSCKTVNKKNKLISINSTSKAYVKGGRYINSFLQIDNASMFKNMKYVSDGDSITAQQTWQPLVVNNYGLEWQNIGIGGQKYSGSLGFWATSFDETDDIANSFASLKGTYHIPYDVDFVTLMGGVNDWGQNIPLGTQDSTDTETVLGGFNKYIELFYTNFPTVPLVVMSPTISYKTISGFSGYENALGLSCYDYADAIEERCKTLGIPYVDIIRNYGVNYYNHAIYTPDRTHPNALGGEKLAGVLMGYMNQLDNFNGGVTQQVLDYDSVTNGTFSSATGWTLNDWSVTGGVATITDANGTQLLSQDIGIEVGKTYRLKYRIKDYVQGDVTIGVGGYISTTHNTNGTFIKELEVTNALSNSLLEITALNTFTGSIDYIIVQEIL